jgi:hypothetical protein
LKQLRSHPLSLLALSSSSFSRLQRPIRTNADKIIYSFEPRESLIPNPAKCCSIDPSTKVIPFNHGNDLNATVERSPEDGTAAVVVTAVEVIST